MGSGPPALSPPTPSSQLRRYTSCSGRTHRRLTAASVWEDLPLGNKALDFRKLGSSTALPRSRPHSQRLQRFPGPGKRFRGRLPSRPSQSPTSLALSQVNGRKGESSLRPSLLAGTWGCGGEGVRKGCGGRVWVPVSALSLTRTGPWTRHLFSTCVTSADKLLNLWIS